MPDPRDESSESRGAPSAAKELAQLYIDKFNQHTDEIADLKSSLDALTARVAALEKSGT